MCAAGAADDADFPDRLRLLLADFFESDFEALGDDAWDLVSDALKWAGAESGMWDDVLRIGRTLMGIAPKKRYGVDLGLKASSVLESMLEDEDAAFEELLDVIRLAPFSVELIDTICARVRGLRRRREGALLDAARERL